MSATTLPLVDWVQLHYNQQDQLQRCAPSLVECLANSLRLNAESYQRLYGEPVTQGFVLAACTIAVGDRSVAIARDQCRVSVKVRIGQERSEIELEVALGVSGQPQLRLANEFLSIEEASKRILMPILFPKEASSRAQGAGSGR